MLDEGENVLRFLQDPETVVRGELLLHLQDELQVEQSPARRQLSARTISDNLLERVRVRMTPQLSVPVEEPHE